MRSITISASHVVANSVAKLRETGLLVDGSINQGIVAVWDGGECVYYASRSSTSNDWLVRCTGFRGVKLQAAA